ncbi:MAG: HNH endonuclease [Chloroflexi bacterium]|nr:HNH endonuclease [Chloroflexota bacterium]
MPEGRVSTQLKKEVVERAKDCCEYCRSQASFATQSFSVEHILPKSKRGKDQLDNLALACQGCNNHKYNKTEGRDPITDDTVSLYHPRNQPWQDHFTWNDDFTLIIGLTSIGRATIETLQLNRAELINLRRVLYTMGEHPPTHLHS